MAFEPSEDRSAWASTQSDQSSLSAWRKLGSLATHWAHSEDSDQTGRMPRLIWVFADLTAILLVLSCSGSNAYENEMLKAWHALIQNSYISTGAGGISVTSFLSDSVRPWPWPSTAWKKKNILELGMTKPTKWRVPNKDSDQPVHLRSLISLHCLPEKSLGPWLLHI